MLPPELPLPPFRPPAPRLLIAEDSEDSRTILRHFLSGSPYQVVFAEDGLQAVERALAETFDLVVMDMRMPQMDGYAATREIRRREANLGRPRTAILALSAFSAKTEKPRVLAAGCDGYLEKPLRRGQFLDAIARILPSPHAKVDERLETLLPRYLANRRKDLAVLEEAYAAGDFARIQEIGHRLAGTGGSYGFPELSGIGERLYLAAQATDLRDLEKGLQDLEAALPSLAPPDR